LQTISWAFAGLAAVKHRVAPNAAAVGQNPDEAILKVTNKILRRNRPGHTQDIGKNLNIINGRH
jgi:hypothetical protein